MWLVAVSLLLCLSAAHSAAIPDDCKEHWAEQRLDHFRWHGGQEPTFQQRYFVCDKHWKTEPPAQKGPIFFYAGNESPVTAYMKSAGLMFENREAFEALVIFIEHRYYGETQPFGPDSWKVDPSYLTVEQAMADYTTLLRNLTEAWGATRSPIIAFGGSYGGMLAAWMRRRYPHIITGAVAASAPVGQFPADPGFKPSAFWDVVTRDATPAAGAAADCVDNTREAFRQLFRAGVSPEGRSQLQATFQLCDPLQDEAAVQQLAYWAQGAFDAFAMGNFPFPTDYMTGEGQGELPAWPMRAACERMSSLAPSARHSTLQHGTAHHSTPQHGTASGSGLGRRGLLGRLTARLFAGTHHSSSSSRDRTSVSTAGGTAAVSQPPAGPVLSGRAAGQVDLLGRLASAAALLYNASGSLPCFSLDLAGPAAGSVGAWDYQVCTEFLGQELPYFPAAASSMFWDQGPFDWQAICQHCRSTWGVEPSKTWMVEQHGGLDWRDTSNIVFSNGLLDPWSVFGVREDVSDSVVAVLIPDGAHHLDLMDSRPDDSNELRAARQTIMAHVLRWVESVPVPSAAAAGSSAGGAGGVAAAARVPGVATS